jgi:predicted Zn-ribbon and HTH transcriptional regulator
MDISSFLPQLGISAIFVAASYKLYNDSRQDSLRREEQMRADSKEREEKLIEHLDKVADTLNNINDRLVMVEQCVKREDDK